MTTDAALLSTVLDLKELSPALQLCVKGIVFEFRSRHLYRLRTVVLLVLTLCGMPFRVDAESDLYGANPGPYGARVEETLVLHDGKRGKDLQLRITYPDGGRGFPLIVWSHGAKGTKDMYQPLIKHWVSHGYVCIQPNHSDSRAFGFKTSKTETFRDWQSRPEDIVFVLDALDEIARRMSGLGDRMDKSLIGVGVHSFGAHTAQLIGGAEARDPRASAGYRSYADKRTKAVMLLSPQGSGPESLLDSGSWRNMRLPAISLTGSNDLGRTGKNWRWRLEPFLYAPPQDKYLVYIEGAHHGFGGLVGVADFPNAGPEDPGQVRYVRASSLAFWDAYLKTSDTAMAFLRGDKLERLSHGKARLLPGGVSDSEIEKLGQGVQSGDRAQGGTLPAEKIISTFDRDGNGSLSRDEMPPRLAPAFDRIDRNGDGLVSEEELTRGLESLRGRENPALNPPDRPRRLQ